MDDIDQDGINNQPELLDARAAAALLGVKRETLYAYASRGLLRAAPGERAGERRYAREDLLRLKARAEARAGHGPVAAAALHWGEPVLPSALTEITGEGPRYRGQSAVDLVARRVPFEDVAELLWTGAIPPAPAPGKWPATWSDGPALAPGPLRRLVPEGAAPLSALSLLVPVLALRDPARFALTRDAELARARRLLRHLAAGLALAAPDAGPRFTAALRAGRVAQAAATALGATATGAAAQAVDAALVLLADHELNPSTFCARVAASAGADLYACVSAALAALSGPRHGGACDRVEALVAEAGRARDPAEVVRERFRRGESVPGFGQPLYPGGDPRTPPLLEGARALAPRRLRTIDALIDAMRDAGQPPPSVDVGLVALALALGLPAGSAAGLFAVGRAAGWVAHVLEQRASPALLRPRARYTGPRAPGETPAAGGE